MIAVLSLSPIGVLAGEMATLGEVTIAAGPDQSAYVQHAIEELSAYLKECTGNEVRMVTAAEGLSGTVIFVGPDVCGAALPDKGLGEEGYRIKVAVSVDSSVRVFITGNTPRGTKAGLSVFMKIIRAEHGAVSVSAALDLSGKPALAKRGMHFNGWAFNYPYSFRSWREADWQAYLDLLAVQNVNLFYLWPFIEIMPVPLSSEDEAYLEECRRVVDYAQQKHGMEVWIMQCTNRVAKDRCGVADPRLRPYWRPAQEDLNPGNPEHFQAIMASREAMYRIVNNADGVCNIDSDPGFCPGSPLADYVKVLQGCRGLLDRHNIHGKQAKLINWMLWGWGREGMKMEGLAEHQRDTLQAIRQGLPEPWELICSQFGFLDADDHMFLPVCREEGVLGKAVFLPYGNIEFEPSYPKTNLEIDAIRRTFAEQVDVFPELGGAMGNVQTPLLQFPDIFYFTSAMFDADYRNRTEQEVMADLAGYLYPEQKPLIADCFLAMKEREPDKVGALAGRLDSVIREERLGRPGLFGRKLFPDYRIVATSLLLQLRLRAAQEALEQDASPTEKRLCEYFDAYLAWDTTHGWHTLWGWDKWPPSDERFAAVAEKLWANLGDDKAREDAFERIRDVLSSKYDDAAIREGCIKYWK